MSDAVDRRSIPKHEPTPEEIRAACLRFQASWSENERRKRCAWSVEQQQVELKEIEIREIAE